MRESHLEQIRRWGQFIREHPNDWKIEHTEFINSLFDKQKQFYDRLSKTLGGIDKIKKLRKL